MKNTTLKSIDCKGSIDDVLNEVFKGSNISYVIKGNEVILKVEKTESTQQKKAKIIGIVTDSKTGEPIIGATVQLLGTTTGVITDVDGKFELAAFPKNEIQISYIGYVTKKVKVGSQKVMSITLAEDAQQLMRWWSLLLVRDRKRRLSPDRFSRFVLRIFWYLLPTFLLHLPDACRV